MSARILPTGRGFRWWWCSIEKLHPTPRMVIDNGRGLVVNMAGTGEPVSSPIFEWTAPIPGPAVCAALAQYAAAVVATAGLTDKDHRLGIAGAAYDDVRLSQIALNDAIRAEREGGE